MQRLLRTLTQLTLATLFALPANAMAAQLSKAEEAAAVSIAARAKAREGRFGLCATMYHEAWRMDPKQPGYLYSAARCEQKAGQLAKAERDYLAFMKTVSAGHQMYGRANQHLREVRAAQARQLAKRRAAAVRQGKDKGKGAKNKPPVKATARKVPKPNGGAAGGVRRGADDGALLGWTVAGTGAALSGVGIWLLMDAASRIADLEQRLTRDGDNPITAISHDDAVAEQDAANLRRGLGFALTGVGVAGVGLGAWLALRDPGPRQVLLLPMGRGAALRVRF